MPPLVLPTKRNLTVCCLPCAALIATLAAAPSRAADAPKSPYTIVCTTGMIADVVRQVAGERATVDNIIGEGVDPHLYQATRGDMLKLLNANVVFYNGLLLEGKITDTLVKVARSRPVYAVSDLIEPERLLEPPGLAGHYDPHLWMDVSLWKRCTEMVMQALSEFDPQGAETYRANFERYARELDELDAYVRRVLDSIPEASRVIVTAHDAFNYMGRAYALDVRGIQGISTESEAGLADINALVDLLVDRKIKAVFVETSVSEKNIRALIEGAMSRGHRVAVGGNLFSDAMGKPGTYEGTYIGMIDHNATTIARALGGSAPHQGMNDKLRSEGP
jgi:manganese/zinc/iron transport system substrate-binding protein